MTTTARIRVRNGKPQTTAKPEATTKPRVTPTWVGRVPELKPGNYADGLPIHQVQYLCYKLMLRPNHFTSRRSLFEFGKVLKAAAKPLGVGFTSEGFQEEPLKIREVLFIDTPSLLLYKNAFILRRRIPYQDGFPVGDPEIVFKFRHPDMQKAAETDVRPQILGGHRVKFKCQALPLKDQLGGVRLLFSHNVQFPRSNAGEGDKLSMESITRIFPVLERIQKPQGERFDLVSDTIVEEVLQDIGELDFGQGVTANTSMALWRTRGEHRPLIGEFAFQFKFKDRKEMVREAMQRAETYFIALQYEAADWISLTATKTGMVYRLLGNKPTSHE